MLLRNGNILNPCSKNKTKKSVAISSIFCSENVTILSPPLESSAHPGVHWDNANGKWCARICNNGKQYHLRYFTEEGDAAAIYASESEEGSA